MIRTIVAVLLALASAFSFAQNADDKIIVSGASGNLGGLAVRALLDRGVPASRLILVSRTPDELAEFAALGASTRFGDFTQPESLPAAYAGGKRMLLVSIGGGNFSVSRPELHKRAIDAAKAAGVEHVVYTSWAAISRGETGGISADHVATENILKQSGVGWTLLRNSVYMDGLASQGLGVIDSGRATVPANGGGMGYVTRADCAEAAAAVLTTDGHEGKTYDITGPELVGPREIAAAAGAVSGKDIVIVTGGGGGGFGSSGLDFVSQDFETITGRRATSIRDLLAQALAARAPRDTPR